MRGGQDKVAQIRYLATIVLRMTVVTVFENSVFRYNEYIKKKFEMSAEDLFDNNMYAFSIEMAMPELFDAAEGKKDDYAKIKTKLEAMDEDIHYQMQDLAFSYYKVYMYGYLKNEEKILVSDAETNLADEYKKHFDTWVIYLDKGVKKTKNNAKLSEQETKEMDANMYSWIVQFMGDGESESLDTKMAFLLVSHIYASEAYLSRGALRVVVGAQQMNRDAVKKRLTPLDHWCTMIENYGDTLKEYQHSCLGNKLNVGSCLMKLSKYMWRTFNSAEQLYKTLAEKDKALDKESQDAMEKIKMFGVQTDFSLTDVLKHWMDDLKDKSITDIKEVYDPKQKYNSKSSKVTGEANWTKKFLDKLGCHYNDQAKEMPLSCIVELSAVMKRFNGRMIQFTNKGLVAKKI